MRNKLFIKSILEEISENVFSAKTLQNGKDIIINFINQKNIDSIDKNTILKNVNECKTLIRLQTYICNSLLAFEGMGSTQFNKTARQAASENI